jgi:hypothetical protein
MSNGYGSSAPPSSARSSGCLKFGLIGCGAIIVLVVLLIVGAGIWWNRNKGELMSGGAAAAREGARFGLAHDEAACFEEGQRRATDAADIQETFTVGAFVRGCLEYSRPTPGFCENVPPPNAIRRTIAWQNDRCGTDGVCKNVLQNVQIYCTEGRPKRTAADTLLMDTSAGGWTGGTGQSPGPGQAEAADSSSF